MSAVSFIRITLLTALFLALAGCNLPASEASPTPDITQAYQTVEARLTQAATLTIAASLTPTTATATPEATATSPAAQPTLATLLPSATQSVRACDQAAPGVPIDVTIPDDTRMAPGQTFTKTWRLQNTGTCTWTTDYSIALFSGDAMNAPTSVRLPTNVAPGQTVDISVDLVAPQTAGTYTGNWKLRNAAGTWFGIGPSGNLPFWVRIVVAGTPISTITVTVTPTQSTPYPGQTPSPGTQASGSLTLLPGDLVNLDTNQINTGAGEDLAYRRKDNGKLELAPANIALIAVFGRGTPTIDDCASAALSSAALKLQDLGAGLYLCYRTDQGLYGWLRLLSLDESNGALGIQFLTWSLP